jgi:pSer/pThr/pTyr-binding forkhead associated (FHA) protein
MGAYLEVRTLSGPRLVVMEGERLSVGKHESNDLTLPWDASLSRLHAVFERYAAGWCVRDLDSRNGTWVNGERILRERPLRHGDRILLGRTQVVFRADEATARWGPTETQPAERAPELTRRERDVLVALCRRALNEDVFPEPASNREIAEALVVSEAAVRQHLLRLYDKFGIHEGSERRRVRLANQAIRRGAISMGDLWVEDGP